MTMAQVDFTRLQKLTIGSNADEEAVTVNTRALIDKVLARYSGDWTTLRELIQNAADAGAARVIIKFETLPSSNVPVPSHSDQASLLSHTISHHTIHRLVVSNDGQHFQDGDWSRLKRIAEGNPDETKIGAFGVGFYSVFADCEEPFVISGRKTMAFLWKGNSLFTKASTFPENDALQDTTFVLNQRNTSSLLPNLLSVCKFLTTSLTFVGLQHIEFWIDSWKILQLQKKTSPPVQAKIPSRLDRVTVEKTMQVLHVQNERAQIDAVWMNVIAMKEVGAAPLPQPSEEQSNSFKSFFTRIAIAATQNSAAKRAAKEAELAKEQEICQTAHQTSKATVFLRISTVHIRATIVSHFAVELERATKKPPPRNTRIAILTSSQAESAASFSSSSGITASSAEQVFASVLPNKHGRIFIGFPTAQTTGMLLHISAPSVIPTVERENIDLNSRYVRTWNIEMLRCAGIACRVAYSEAFGDLKRDLEASVKAADRTMPASSDIESLIPQAVHILNQYSAKESTPSSMVGQFIEEAFWHCSRKASIELLSTKGVLPSSQIRVVLQPLSFVDNIPVVPPELAKDASSFIQQLYNKALVCDMSVTDMRKELEARALSEPQVIEFLKWLVEQSSSNSLDVNTARSLLNSAVGAVDESLDKSRLVALSEIETFVSGRQIPPNMPFPETTIPFKLTKDVKPDCLVTLGWSDLQIVPWVRWLIEAPNRGQLSPERNIIQSIDFSASVLQVISKTWDQQSQNTKNSLIDLLKSRTIMPTRLGMRLPSEAYFSSVKIFDDLPTLTNDVKVKEKVLIALGVRKTIELNVVFDRLMSSPANGTLNSKWSFNDLISYLVQVQKDIPPTDTQRLRTAEICPVEGKENDQHPGRLVAIHQLYEPKHIHRDLQLPILYWNGGHWNPLGQDATFLANIGLKRYPPIAEIIQIMLRAINQQSPMLYRSALNYYLENYDRNQYASAAKETFAAAAILPVEGRKFPHASSPKACFTNASASVLGYPILQAALLSHAYKFGVQSDPPMSNCINTLIGNPPASRNEAILIFNYFASRLGDVDTSLCDRLSSAEIVPLPSRIENGGIRRISPKMCFLGDPTTYGDILDFVEFGNDANTFLLKVGAKNEPTSIELARMVQENPYRVLDLLQQERYLNLLRRLAENYQTLKNDKQLWKLLKESCFLAAYQEFPVAARRSSVLKEEQLIDLEQYDDEKAVRELSLRVARDIVVEDTFREYVIFKDHLFVAPQDSILETFYIALGVPTLSSILQLDERVGDILRNQDSAVVLRKLIVERSRIYLHEYGPDHIRHDSKWLGKNLVVFAAQTLSLTTTLKGYHVTPHKENKSAILSRDQGRATLYVNSQPDFYEVSRCIVPMLLKRSRRHDVLALEMVLISDLRRLKHKGYNVDRILRQQEYETRVAAEQQRQQQVKLEKEAAQRVKDEQERIKQIQPPPQIEPPPPYDDGSDRDALNQMPGGFEPDSPSHPAKGSKKLLSSIQDWGKQMGSNIRKMKVSDGIAPGSSDLMHNGQSMVPQPKPTLDPQNMDRNVNNSLISAIACSRSFNSNSLYSPPRSTVVEEARSGSYCDITPVHNLVFASTTSNGIRVFLSKDVSLEAFNSNLSSNQAGLAKYSSLLNDLASIFSMPLTTFHVFWTPHSPTIAFNSEGSLFFNYHYFQSLHLANFDLSRDKRIEAVAYWWVTLCHELAHNLVKEHSAAHSFYTESFASQYFAKAMQKALQQD